MNTHYDNNPQYGGVINFASNTSQTDDITQAKIEAFNYGFKLGWQSHWYEVKELEEAKKARE